MRKTIQKAVLFFFAFMLITMLGAAEKASAKDITIKKTGYVADSMNGVDAIYRPGGNDGSNATYSCAAFVKKYYKEYYGKTVSNLFASATPAVAGSDYVVKVKEPAAGDIVREKLSGGSTHWSIVKEITEDGEVIVIEQNFKWRVGGTTYARVNRAIDTDRVVFFRLNSENKALNTAEKEMKDAVEAAKIQ